MFPHTSNFAYNVLTLFWFPLWAVLEPVVGILTSMTVITLLGCALNGYWLFVLLLDENVTPGLALIGGAALQLFPINRYFYYNTHINYHNFYKKSNSNIYYYPHRTSNNYTIDNNQLNNNYNRDSMRWVSDKDTVYAIWFQDGGPIL